jgi:hypothetical protein
MNELERLHQENQSLYYTINAVRANYIKSLDIMQKMSILLVDRFGAS